MLSLLAAAAVLPGCYGAIYSSFDQVPTQEFDYVVVGGGTAGLVVANRLTEDPSVSVLVLEAGVSHEGQTLTQIPFLCGGLMGTPLDWNYNTEPQKALNNRSITYPRGKLLGGSSSINFMVYTRGASDDFNKYAQLTGDSGWNWDNMYKYVLKAENLVQPADNHDTTGQVNPRVHGYGPLKVSLPGHPVDLDNRVIKTSAELKSEFPFNLDMNSGKLLGLGWVQSTIANGARVSSAIAYLAPEFVSRKNLHVLTGATVTSLKQSRLIWKRQYDNSTVVDEPVAEIPTSEASAARFKAFTPVFDTVEFSASANALRQRVKARREIVLSAGSIGTPQILMLSGIGNPIELLSTGILPVLNSPGVGQNMGDHPRLANVYTVAGNLTQEPYLRDALVQGAAVGEWIATKLGPLVNGLINHILWARLPKTASIFRSFADPSSGPGGAHYELLFSSSFLSNYITRPLKGSYMSITVSLISPIARGWVKLASKNPFDAPIVNPNFLGSAFDLYTMKEAVLAANRFMAAKTMKGYVLELFGPLKDAIKSDAALTAYVREHTGTTWHPLGTAAMGPKLSKTGVVGPDLKVKGVSGIRIVDGSVLPFVPSAHPQAPIYAVAERASDLIKADRR